MHLGPGTATGKVNQGPEAPPLDPSSQTHLLGEVELREANEVLYENGEVFSLPQEWLPGKPVQDNLSRRPCPTLHTSPDLWQG